MTSNHLSLSVCLNQHIQTVMHSVTLTATNTDLGTFHTVRYYRNHNSNLLQSVLSLSLTIRQFTPIAYNAAQVRFFLETSRKQNPPFFRAG